MMDDDLNGNDSTKQTLPCSLCFLICVNFFGGFVLAPILHVEVSLWSDHYVQTFLLLFENVVLSFSSFCMMNSFRPVVDAVVSTLLGPFCCSGINLN